MTIQNLRFTSSSRQYVAFDLPKGGGSLSVEDFKEQYPSEVLPAAYTPPAITWADIRSKRNALLKDTDWQAGTDVTMTDAQKAYRKKLRDLPATNSDPTKIVFPDAP